MNALATMYLAVPHFHTMHCFSTEAVRTELRERFRTYFGQHLPQMSDRECSILAEGLCIAQSNLDKQSLGRISSLFDPARATIEREQKQYIQNLLDRTASEMSSRRVIPNLPLPCVGGIAILEIPYVPLPPVKNMRG